MFFRKLPQICLNLQKSLKTFQNPINLVRFTPLINASFHTISKESNEISLNHTQSFNFRFIGMAKRRGMLRQKHKTAKNSMKKRGKINVKYLHKVSNHNGLLKRIKIVKKFCLLIP